MRLACDGREISAGRAGGLRAYADSVVRSLSEHADDIDLTVYTDREVPPTYGGARWRLCPPAQLVLREQFYLPRMLERDGADLAHFPANTGPARCPVPYVLTLHDTFCIERGLADIALYGRARNKLLSLYAKLAPRVAARRARRIITVSQYSARRIASVLRLDPDAVDVAPQSIHPRFRPIDSADIRRQILASTGADRLGLVIGSVEPRKNLARVLNAFTKAAERDPGLGLVLTWPRGVELSRWLSKHAPGTWHRLRVVQGVTDEGLAQLYSSVDFLVFASQREGFGLPVVEAFACGCPVITSNTTCLPETAAGAAVLVDPLDVDAISEAIGRVAQDDALRRSLRQAGFARAAEFSDSRTAEALTAAYMAALSGSHRVSTSEAAAA